MKTKLLLFLLLTSNCFATLITEEEPSYTFPIECPTFNNNWHPLDYGSSFTQKFIWDPNWYYGGGSISYLHDTFLPSLDEDLHVLSFGSSGKEKFGSPFPFSDMFHRIKFSEVGEVRKCRKYKCPIPEPTTIAILGFGILFCCIKTKRRRR